MSNLLSVIVLSGQKVLATATQIDVIESLTTTCTKGGFAVIQDYIPSSGWVTSPVQTIHAITKFSVSKLYERKLVNIAAITFADVQAGVAKDDKLSQLSLSDVQAIFDTRKDMEMASLQKTLDGDRSDAHRQGHDRCYLRVATGIKVNLVTERGDDKLMHPVLNGEGIPSIASIMVNALFVNVNTTAKGVRKTVNSGNPVRMSALISRAIDKPTTAMRTISLKSDNFSKLSIDKARILPSEYLNLD